MIKARRITLSNGTPYQNVSIYDSTPNLKVSRIPKIFHDNLECYIIDNLNKKLLINQKAIQIIELKIWNYGKNELIPITKVVVGDTSYGPAWIVPEKLYEKFNIPDFYSMPSTGDKIDQFTWVADNKLYITREDLITLIET